MTYLAFVIALLLAAVAVGVVRVFGGKIGFETAFKVVANVLVMLPVAAMAFFVWAVMAMGIAIIATAILNAVGLLPTVAQWPVWNLLPFWLWLALGAVLLFGAGHLYYWARDRTRVARPTVGRR